MLDGLFMLLTLSIIMAVASFLAGSLPLSVALSQSRLRLVSSIGMGVLVGTALIVIVPEGVETLYSANDFAAHEGHVRRSLDIQTHAVALANVPAVRIAPRSPGLFGSSSSSSSSSDDPSTAEEMATAEDYSAMPGPVLPAGAEAAALKNSKSPPTTPTEPGVVGALSGSGLDDDDVYDPAADSPQESTVSSPGSSKEGSGSSKADTKPPPSAANPISSHSRDTPQREPHAWIGLSLVLGFILMYLLDTLPLTGPSSSSRAQNNIYSLSDLSSAPGPSAAPQTSQRSLSTTLGLCIHAAADGIALGASSSSSTTTSLSLIIFVAIMVHKAPAAFGLTSVLLKQGLGKRTARAHLVVFSCAAPLGAILTWLLVRALGGGGDSEPAVMRWWTGVLLLFSGGTFLYVAMHTMNDEDNAAYADDVAGNGYLDFGSTESRSNSIGMGTGRRGGGGGGGVGGLGGGGNGVNGHGGGGGGRGGKEGRSPKLVFAAVAGMLLPLITQIGHAH